MTLYMLCSYKMASIPQETIMRHIQTHDQINFYKYCTSPNSGSLDSIDNMPWLTLSLFTDPFSTTSVGVYTKININCSIYK